MGESYSGLFADLLGPPSPLERILGELTAERSHHLAHICQNPNCFNKYFFAKRGDQKYCTPECAKPAQRGYKRKWWGTTGKSWRSERGGKTTSGSDSQVRAVGRNKQGVRQLDVTRLKTQKAFQQDESPKGPKTALDKKLGTKKGRLSK
jgi:hypothetical protein